RFYPALTQSCNACATTGPTGLALSGTSSFQLAGSGCTAFNAPVSVQTGETYALFVSNRSNPPLGNITFDFTASTASILDNVPPRLLSIDTPVTCNQTTLNVNFSEPVRCAVVGTNNFVLKGPGGTTFSLNGLQANFCDGSGVNATARKFTLVLNK